MGDAGELWGERSEVDRLLLDCLGDPGRLLRLLPPVIGQLSLNWKVRVSN
jgi:hypothetical protein